MYRLVTMFYIFLILGLLLSYNYNYNYLDTRGNSPFKHQMLNAALTFTRNISDRNSYWLKFGSETMLLKHFFDYDKIEKPSPFALQAVLRAHQKGYNV